MPDLHEQLARIAQQQGKEPIDGTRIEGFGPGAPPFRERPAPPETPPEVPPASESYGAPVEPPAVPEGPPVRPQGTPAPRPRGIPDPDLVILDRDAEYKGRKVTLSEDEWTQVRKAVVRALKRDVDSLEVDGVKPRRKRKTKKSQSVTATDR